MNNAEIVQKSIQEKVAFNLSLQELSLSIANLSASIEKDVMSSGNLAAKSKFEFENATNKLNDLKYEHEMNSLALQKINLILTTLKSLNEETLNKYLNEMKNILIKQLHLQIQRNAAKIRGNMMLLNTQKQFAELTASEKKEIDIKYQQWQDFLAIEKTRYSQDRIAELVTTINDASYEQICPSQVLCMKNIVRFTEDLSDVACKRK